MPIIKTWDRPGIPRKICKIAPNHVSPLEAIRKAKTMSEFFPIIQLEGAPHYIGLAHGRALAGAIKKNLDLYYSMVRGLNGFNPEQCLGHATGYLKTMEVDAPVLLEEMER